MKKASLLLGLALTGCGPGMIIEQVPIEVPVVVEQPTIELIDPCPEEVTAFPEVLVCINGGELFALYYAPPNSFLTPLIPGNYRTTDKRECSFRVVSGCEVEAL